MMQASVWYKQHRLEEARPGALRAVDVCEKLGIAGRVKRCRALLQRIQEELDPAAASGQSNSNCEQL